MTTFSNGILKGVLTLAARLTTLLPVLAEASMVMAQSQLKFEVASVKPSTEQTMSIRLMPGGRLVATAPLKLLIMNAYGLQVLASHRRPGLDQRRSF
jgi:hypothetical protein